nr:thioredoxin family protein [Candidatus Njordarchaeota archaeon]
MNVEDLFRVGVKPEEYLKKTLESPRAADWRSVIERHRVDSKIVEGLSKIKKRFTLICFSAYWCKDCLRYVPPLIESVRKAENNNLRLAMVDYDAHKSLAEQADTKSIPQLIVFNDKGSEVRRIIEIPSPKYTSIEEELLTILLNKK